MRELLAPHALANQHLCCGMAESWALCRPLYKEVASGCIQIASPITAALRAPLRANVAPNVAQTMLGACGPTPCCHTERLRCAALPQEITQTMPSASLTVLFPPLASRFVPGCPISPLYCSPGAAKARCRLPLPLRGHACSPKHSGSKRLSTPALSSRIFIALTLLLGGGCRGVEVGAGRGRVGGMGQRANLPGAQAASPLPLTPASCYHH